MRTNNTLGWLSNTHIAQETRNVAEKYVHDSQFLFTFFDLDLSTTNGIVPSKIYNKLDDFYLEIVNFSFLDGYGPRSPSYGVYIS